MQEHKRDKMSFVDAAELILREKAIPLHSKEIIDEALDRGLIKTNGKTPHSTLTSEIYLENKRRGKHRLHRFQKAGKNRWILVKQ